MGLPKLGIARIKAKVETGALTSSLHAFEIEEFDYDGKPFVRFRIHPFQKNDEFVAESIAEVSSKHTVAGRNGQAGERWVVSTDLHVGDQVWPVEINLMLGARKKFRLVLGRNAIKGRAIVDPDSSFLLGKSWKKSG